MEKLPNVELSHAYTILYLTQQSFHLTTKPAWLPNGIHVEILLLTLCSIVSAVLKLITPLL
jgi:hypothetical protein